MELVCLKNSKAYFETFERERNTTLSHIDGSGIGMGITKKLVELMDGTIEVESKQGEVPHLQ